MRPMSSALLNTNLYIPRARPDPVLRSRLTERLQAEAWRPFNLISAPAGFGKTTLVSEWVRANEWPSVWISLDEGDNNLPRFLSYFITALQSINIDCRPSATMGRVKALFIGPGCPWENGYVESFNGKLRDEFLSGEVFSTFAEAQILNGVVEERVQPGEASSCPGIPSTCTQEHIPTRLAFRLVQFPG